MLIPSSSFELPFKVNYHPQVKMNSSSLSLSGGLLFLNPDYAVGIVTRIENFSETRSWSDFVPKAYL